MVACIYNPALWGSQKDQEFQANIGLIVSLKSATADSDTDFNF